MNDKSIDPGVPVSNEDFLRQVAGNVRPNESLWVCGFIVPPSPDAPWKGREVQLDERVAVPPTHNAYFSVAAVRDGRRLKANFARMIVLVADDVDVERLERVPSYVLQTSPGKWQAGFILADDAESRNASLCERVLRAMVKLKLVPVDSSGNSITRYVRLPVGSNTKARESGAFAHRLTEWRPHLRYTLGEAAAAFGVALDAEAAQSLPVTDVAAEWVDDAPGRLDPAIAAAEIIDGSVLYDNLMRLAAHHAAKGMPQAEIVATLRDLMDRSAAKHADDHDSRWKVRFDGIAEIVSSAFKRFGNSYARKEDFSDLGNANLLARLTSGDLRFVVEAKAWIQWRGGRWETDATGAAAVEAATLVARYYSREADKLRAQLAGMDSAAAKKHQKTIDAVSAWEKACRGRRGIENMLALASKHPAFALSSARLDVDPHLLGVQNGVVDLRTGHLRPDAREELVTRRCAYAYAPSAQAPRWRQFIAEVTGAPIAAERNRDDVLILNTVGRYRPRPAYAAYLQRALGYSATGLTREHKLFVPHGEHGANGKNVVFDTVHRVLGSYARTTRPEILMVNRRNQADANSATPATAALAGSRFAMSSEPRDGAVFDNAVVKALTGEREIATRELHRSASTTLVTFHIWLLCNAKPPVDHLEQAVVGRILMLPFDRQWNRPGVPDRDPALPDGDKLLASTLEDEFEGILAWLVEGAVRYMAEGLEPCEEVTAATRAYFKGQDPVGKWLLEQETCAPAIGTTATALFERFERWRIGRESAGVMAAGVAPVTQTAFGLALARHGVPKAKHGTVRYGIAPEMSAEFRVLTPEELYGDLA